MGRSSYVKSKLNGKPRPQTFQFGGSRRSSAHGKVQVYGHVQVDVYAGGADGTKITKRQRCACELI